MHDFYLSSGSVNVIITAKTSDAAKMLFEISNPGMKPSMCLQMADKQLLK